MEFQYDRSARHLKIVDESYGLGFIITGAVGNIPAICIADYGLSESCKRVLASAVFHEQFLEGEIDGLNGECIVEFYTRQNSPAAKMREGLLQMNFNEDPLGLRYTKREFLPEDLEVFPVDGVFYITEAVGSHVRSKLESVFHCAQTPADLISVSTLPTTKKNTPFFLVRARLHNPLEESERNIRNWCQRLLPEVKFLRIGLDEDGFIHLGFYPTSSLDEIVSHTTPKFPPDTIDGYQEVELSFSSPLTDAEISMFRDVILEAGAAVRCEKIDNRRMVLDIPCSYGLGGVVGRAFESRKYFITNYINRNLSNYGMQPLSLQERKGVYRREEPIKRNPRLVTELQEEPAFLQRMFIIPEAQLPYLFSHTEQDEVYLLCEKRNFIAAKRNNAGGIELFHGIPRNGEKINNIWDFYPDLVKIGNGRKI